jgi:Ca2+/Na+ antiporter
MKLQCYASCGAARGGLLLLTMLYLFQAVEGGGDDESDCNEASEQKASAPWVQDGGFLVLIIGVSAMFWGLAVVCEEYFVPALNVLCEELNVPDDVAGATFMAAGASSPELFTSFIALFINHSAIGVGTVVGSEIFNHMIICSGSVMYSSTGVLQLNKWIFTRDVFSYFVSLVVLIWALKG